MSAQAEAEGQEYALASYRGHDWRIPLDVDTWPLTAVTRSIGVDADRVTVVNPVAVVEALSALLDYQWPLFMAAAPKYSDIEPATHVFAAAVGMGATQERNPDGLLYDKVFGAIPRLLAVLQFWPTAVESDLSRFWGIDYRDRWRFDKHGRRRLTLRQIHARLSHLPADSALAVELGRRSPVELLLMDLYEPLAGRVHPARPLTPQQAAERKAKADQKAKAVAAYEARRLAQGHRGVTAGLVAARENAERGKVSSVQESS